MLCLWKISTPHISHIHNLINLLRNKECKEIIIGVIGFKDKNGQEILNICNPLSLEKRLKCLRNVLRNERISLEGILLENTIIDLIKEIIKRYLYDKNRDLLRLAGIKIGVKYSGKRIISASEIREMVKEDNNA